MSKSRGVLGGAVVLYFIIALEVLIMISPFAAFFYAVFNPVLLFLARWPATNWLAAFFLPHMVLPPGVFLQVVRVAGSVLFVCGLVVFVACAVQVYFHQFLRRGPALGGVYRWIRHPQYLALAVTGLGLAILWPRFLTIVLWVVMVGLYWVLAKDEERRMIRQFGGQYRDYMLRTRMFLPRGWGRVAERLPLPEAPALRATIGLLLVAAGAIGGAFALRAYTIARLPLWRDGRITAVAILPDDAIMLEHRMAEVLELPDVKSRLARSLGPMLVYLVPQQYVMQGMIADTGPEWRLYEHHQTLAMIADWIFHPFRHLQGGHMMMEHSAGGASADRPAPGGMVRRLVFLRVGSPLATPTRSALFGINAIRAPQFYADVDIHNLLLLDLKPLGPGTGWGRVPTPMF
jgi:protein-S-isoprenylcysteine O-methyltransferase Ste14